MTFDQPPVEQAGRVYVPLRSIFEQLGASVVYQNGSINATGQGRTVSLQIGSTNAVVNGQPQVLDSPPFLDGSRTLVPLRFVSQALGASVDWDNNTSTVTIASSGYAAAPVNQSLYLTDRWPYQNARWRQDQIRARFSQPVRYNTVRIRLDGNDVTGYSSVSQTGFIMPVRYSLQPGPHQVRISGVTLSGSRFTTGWDFRV